MSLLLGFFSILISSPESIKDVYALAQIIVVMIIMKRQALYDTSPSLMWFSNLSGIILYLLDKYLYLFLWILVAKIIVRTTFCTSRLVSSICNVSSVLFSFSNEGFFGLLSSALRGVGLLTQPWRPDALSALGESLKR